MRVYRSPEAAGGGTGGGAGEGGGAAQPPTKYEVVVNGETRQLTLDELKTLASKAGGAEARFAEAARMRQEVGQSAVVGEAILKLKQAQAAGTVTEELIRECGAKLGSTSADIEKAVADLRAKGRQTGGGSGKAGEESLVLEEDLPPSVRAKLAKLEEWEKMMPDLQNAAQQTRQQQRQAELEKIAGEVDKDEVLGKLMVDQDGKLVGGRAAQIRRLVQEDVVRRVRNGEDYDNYGPQIRAAAIQAIRQQLDDLGIRGEASGSRKAGSQGNPSLGPADPDLASLLRETPDGPPKRVSMLDPDWDKNLLSRAAHADASLQGKPAKAGF